MRDVRWESLTVAEIPEFGEPERGATYVLRPGGYAVFFDGDGRLAVVATEEGLHLPGGGQEPGESAEAAAVREVSEETGLRVALQTLIGVADELVFSRSENVHYRKRCSFFRAAVIGESEAADAGHELKWMESHVAVRALHHASQRWAVKAALGMV